MTGQHRQDNVRAASAAGASLRIRHGLLLGAVFGSLVTITLTIHQVVQSDEGLALRAQTQADTVQLAQMLQSELELMINPFRSIRDGWSRGNFKTDNELAAAVQVLLNRRRIYGMAAGVDGQDLCRWARSSANWGRRPALNQEVSQQWGPILAEARFTGGEVVYASGPGKGIQAAMNVALPLAPNNGAESASAGSVMLIRLSLEGALDRAVGEHIRREYCIDLRDAHGRVFNVGPLHGVGEGYGETHPVQVGNTYWQLHVWPSNATVRARMHRLAVLVLGGGLVGALVLTGGMWRVMVYRSREIHQAKAHLQALESMNEISAAISGKLGSGREVLDQLAELAKRLLGVSLSGIVLLDEKRERLRALAFVGAVPDEMAREILLDDSPASRSCLESNRILFIEDTSQSPVPINPVVVRGMDSKAMILIPLHIEQQCIGLMVLSDPHPRRFTDAERRLAELLGSQASVILANNRLYEQTRRDAQTQAILLRELHHRVKNNLAGIIGLLSMDEPSLSPTARHWLDRVIERIRMMARTHDLFRGGTDRIGLRQLIEQVLPSLSVIKPASVSIDTRGVDVDAQLSRSQAVGLAMALHELCTNAIQHGLGDGGMLTLRTRRLAGGLAIDVMDNGCGLPTGFCPCNIDYPRYSANLSQTVGDEGRSRFIDAIGVETISIASERGLGLRLVRELVGRELRGTFFVQQRVEGGTIATIEFPLGADGEGPLP